MSFEQLKEYLPTHFVNYTIEKTVKVDEEGNAEQDILRIKGKKRHLMTINLYRTTSTMLVNGPSLNRFQSKDWPIIANAIASNYDPKSESSIKLLLESAKQKLRSTVEMDNTGNISSIQNNHSSDNSEGEENDDEENSLFVTTDEDEDELIALEAKTKQKTKTSNKRSRDNAQLEKLQGMMISQSQQNTSSIDQLVHTINNIETKLSDKLTEQDNRISNLNTKIDRNIKTLNSELSKLQAQKPCSCPLNAISTIDRLESKVKELNDQVKSLQKALVTDQSGYKDILSKEIGNLKSYIEIKCEALHIDLQSKSEPNKHAASDNSEQGGQRASDTANSHQEDSSVSSDHQSEGVTQIHQQAGSGHREASVSTAHQGNNASQQADSVPLNITVATGHTDHREASVSSVHQGNNASQQADSVPLNITKVTRHTGLNNAPLHGSQIRTVLLHDSISNFVNIHRMIPNRNGQKIKCDTLLAAKDKIKAIKHCNSIIIQVGINDTRNVSEDTVKQRFRSLIGEIKQCHPGAEIHVCTLIPPKHALSELDEINRFIHALALTKACKLIQIHEPFTNDTSLYYNALHPKKSAVGKIVALMKSALGLTVDASFESTRPTRARVHSPALPPRFRRERSHNQSVQTPRIHRQEPMTHAPLADGSNINTGYAANNTEWPALPRMQPGPARRDTYEYAHGLPRMQPGPARRDTYEYAHGLPHQHTDSSLPVSYGNQNNPNTTGTYIPMPQAHPPGYGDPASIPNVHSGYIYDGTPNYCMPDPQMTHWNNGPSIQNPAPQPAIPNHTWQESVRLIMQHLGSLLPTPGPEY